MLYELNNTNIILPLKPPEIVENTDFGWFFII
jgi:hypothetical protein